MKDLTSFVPKTSQNGYEILFSKEILGHGSFEKHSQTLKFGLLKKSGDKNDKGVLNFISSENEHPISFRSDNSLTFREIAREANKIADEMDKRKQDGLFPEG